MSVFYGEECVAIITVQQWAAHGHGGKLVQV